ncbi:hypothetical protein BCV70DRAFT_29417 [Testicularia cyperi]|uniref:RanBP2-type domain-containing protein n=1 Tax=Testicularia cyperi TaxID=1882483 RepID=A0A317XLV1_9BASI|nr:hypothetical protein BCV70DRAFT_29417 [Testicularia cyperi]
MADTQAAREHLDSEPRPALSSYLNHQELLYTSPSSHTPALTPGSSSFASLHGDLSPSVTGQTGMVPWRRSQLDGGATPFESSYFSNSSGNAVAAPYNAGIAGGAGLGGNLGGDLRGSLQHAGLRSHNSRSMSDLASLTESFSRVDLHRNNSTDGKVPVMGSQYGQAPFSLSMTSNSDTSHSAPLLIPMQPTGAGVPLTSVVETLANKGSRAAAENPETVAAAFTLSQWGIGIGPGVNPKMVPSHVGFTGRARSSSNEPPIVNTGNSGPMCVQSGDWICTSCGFVNWRRRKVCMRCYPTAEGNEIGRSIFMGEALAKKLAAGLDTNSEEYQRSMQALQAERPKRNSDTNPYNHARLTTHNDQSGYFDSPQTHLNAGLPLRPQASNVLGIQFNSTDFLPPLASGGTHSPYVPTTVQGRHDSPTHPSSYPHPGSVSRALSLPAPSVLHHAAEFLGSPSSTYPPPRALQMTAAEPSRSIWAPAPKRPVPVPVDPEDRASAQERRPRLEPIGTKNGIPTTRPANETPGERHRDSTSSTSPSNSPNSSIATESRAGSNGINAADARPYSHFPSLSPTASH